MATRFVRIDLSDNARDFAPLAVEPGVPLLDRSGANAKIIFRWLGGLAAEPVWEEESVNFHVRDDQGGRLVDVTVRPATASELKGALKNDLALLKERLEKARAETPTERALKKALSKSFQQLTDDPNRNDLDDYFFCYKDVQGQLRLVWCWGYQRVDQEPAPAVICTDQECMLLFVKRPNQSHKCPSCEKALAAKPRKKRPYKRVSLLTLLALLLLLALYWWWTHPTRLIATPHAWKGPVGSRVEFKVQKAGLFFKEDVTRQTVPIVLDPQIAQLDPSIPAAVARNPGRTRVRFHLGNIRPADAELEVVTAVNPDRLGIEPENIVLGIATTARPKVIGQYDDGRKLDLTAAAEWTAPKDDIVYVRPDGLLEGLREGTTSVTARYRATPEGDYITATATVLVRNVKFQGLELAIDPTPVGVGRTSELRIDAVGEDGERYPVAESSRLYTDVTPSSAATVLGRTVRGNHVARGNKLTAIFDDSLTAAVEFDVVTWPGLTELVVMPEKLEMIVGEIADLSIVTPFSEPIKVASTKTDVVEVTSENRLVGRSEGEAQVEVAQGNQRRNVQVTVVAKELLSLVIEPSRLVVPIDDSVRAKPMAWIEGDRKVELAPQVVKAERVPSPRYADFEQRNLRVHGVRPTEPHAPQSLALSTGRLSATAPVEVVVPPLKLQLTPPGPIDLPLGQMMRLQAWATYSGGRRVQVPSERLKWQSAPESKTVSGLELRGDRVAALKPNAGPLPVFANYYGRESNRVVFNSVDARDVTLRLDTDRTLRLTGETGGVALWGTGPKGDVELVPELATFATSNDGVLKVDEKTGGFRAVGVGEATVTAKHAAAQKPASLPFRVYDPAKARLVFDPPSLQLVVDEVGRLQLYLEASDGAKTERVPLSGPGVGYSITRPDAIRWQPPQVVGLQPAPPFELTASYFPYLPTTGSAMISVLSGDPPRALRIVPAEVDLAPGQVQSFRVEQELPGAAGRWQEVRPDAVTWRVPNNLGWWPASRDLRPTAYMPKDAEREFELRAEYGGQYAMAVIRAKAQGPDATDSGASLVLVREPAGEFLPVGHQQRYTVMVEKEGGREPATNIQWPENFENQYVRWEAPVLTAKQGGYEQWLRADVAGRTVLARTCTYEPAQFERPPAPPAGRPIAVRILSDQGQRVRFPVGAEFDDFRVEAHYPNGMTRLVTKKATFRTLEPPGSAPISPVGGRLLGVRPGKTLVSAEFDGVASQQPLEVEVLANVDVDQIRIAPARVDLLPRETVRLEAIGYKNGKSVGVITGLGSLVWQSSNPQVATVSGPAITGINLGSAAVTVALGPVLSQPTPVNVVSSLDMPLVTDQNLIRLRVGESMQIGRDLIISRGGVDLSRQCLVRSALPDVVRYIPETHSLVGANVGASAVAFTHGDKLANVMVEVYPQTGRFDGAVVVEPSSVILAPGQAVELRAYVITPEGLRVDRTDAAVFASDSPARVRLLGNQACAVAPGSARVTATLAGTQNTGMAQVNITNDEISELIVEPSRLAMSVGDVVRMRISGRSSTGTYELYPQPDLAVMATGPNPQAIRITGTNQVNGVAPGEAAVAVSWRNRLTQQVPVSVGDNPWTDLRIDPPAASIPPGQSITYQVSAMRGGQRHVLGPENGVQIFTTDQQVAQHLGGLMVRGNLPGRTTVVAQLGAQRAEAGLTVAEGVVAAAPIGTGPAAVVSNVERPGTVVGGYPGYGYRGIDWWPWGGREIWRGGHRVIGPGGYIEGVGPGGYIEGVGPLAPVGPLGAPAANVDRLKFIPEVLRLAPNGAPASVRVVEVHADGTPGRDVTNDPNLEVEQPADIIRVEKSPAGPMIRPLAVGERRIGAKLGTLTADPLLVVVGEGFGGILGVGESVGVGAGAATAQLQVIPNPLIIWSGEQGTFSTVQVVPGWGQLPIPVEYTVTPAAGQGVVASAGGKMLRGQSVGTTQVTVTVTDPRFSGLSTAATVQVLAGEPVRIEPPEVTIPVGQLTPPFAVIAQGPDGQSYQVPATLQSLDPNVLVVDPQYPGRFVAKGFGQTQVRAEYRGREAYAKVMVSGKRFESVNATLHEGPQSFEVTIKVLAAAEEGPLEYRVYAANQPPPENWVPAEQVGAFRQVTLRSPPLAYGPYGALYTLVLEARTPGTTAVERYPLTFTLIRTIHRPDAKP